MMPRTGTHGALPAALLAAAALLVPVSTRAQPADDDVENAAAARVADAVCTRRIVLLGELPDHGEARGFGVKARIVQRLVERCGFDAVLFEAGSYDFVGFDRAIAQQGDSLELRLARAIGGLWWTAELAPFRRWLGGEAAARRIAIGGIDDQLGATAAFAKATLPAMVGGAVPPARAAECEAAVARYMRWGYDAQVRYDGAERARLAECAQLAASGAPDEVMLRDLASFHARERGGGASGAGAGPDRDSVMAEHVTAWAERLPRDAKIVVWTATTHAARAAGMPTMGARLARRWGDELAAIGFTALRGMSARARQPARPLAPLPPEALEARALVRGANGDPAAWAYLDRAALRSLGTVPSRLLGRISTSGWAAAFDGVLVLRDEAAPTPEPWR